MDWDSQAHHNIDKVQIRFTSNSLFPYNLLLTKQRCRLDDTSNDFCMYVHRCIQKGGMEGHLGPIHGAGSPLRAHLGSIQGVRGPFT